MADIVDDDFLDGCDLDFAAEADDEETQQLRPLFPRGLDDSHLEREWRELFDSDPKLRELAPRTAQALAPGAYSGSGFDTGIADRLRAAGLKVVEIQGWKTRGSSYFAPEGSVDHHTAGSRTGNVPSLGICTNGRADLPGPLCNVLIGRDGTCYVIAAGRANHAGKGGWEGLSGNSTVYGVERENVGTSAEPWTEEQTLTAARCHVALMAWKPKYDVKFCAQHKEWAPGRKSDAHTITGAHMRSTMKTVLAGPVDPAPALKEEEVFYAIYWQGGSAIYGYFPQTNQKFTFANWEQFVKATKQTGYGGEIEMAKEFVEAIPLLNAPKAS